jgi:hypothetical protein
MANFLQSGCFSASALCALTLLQTDIPDLQKSLSGMFVEATLVRLGLASLVVVLASLVVVLPCGCLGLWLSCLVIALSCGCQLLLRQAKQIALSSLFV